MSILIQQIKFDISKLNIQQQEFYRQLIVGSQVIDSMYEIIVRIMFDILYIECSLVNTLEDPKIDQI